MYTQPVGYLLTWTCYATWLHGDERSSVRRNVAKDQWPIIESDPKRLEVMRRKLKQPPFYIDPPARGVINATITQVCKHRGWMLHAANVRTNHVHVVVSGDASPEKMVGDLKAWCTRRLREGGCVAADRRVWTDGGSTRYCWDADRLGIAVDYVLNRQGVDLPSG
jgi:REP element-mobilizing transposase RayT